VLATLRRRIMLNDLTPGAVLTELGLATDLACSQSAIREALLRLDGEGLVRRAGRQGTMVTDLDADAAMEILDLRRRIETRAARRIARRVTAGDLDALLKHQAQMIAAAQAGDAWALIEHDRDFHLALFRISGLHALEPILLRCIQHTHRFRLWAPWHQRPLLQTATRHQSILTALRSNDATALGRALGQHLDTIVERRNAA
jgi:DNA-binding GntR family transcriptional regulator